MFRKWKTNGGIFPASSGCSEDAKTMGPEPPDVIAVVRSHPTTRRVHNPANYSASAVLIRCTLVLWARGIGLRELSIRMNLLNVYRLCKYCPHSGSGLPITSGLFVKTA